MAILHFGEKYRLKRVPKGDSRLIWLEGNHVHVSSFVSEKREIDRMLKKWQDREAKKHLVNRVRILSDLTGLEARKISFRNQRRRWGSCNEFGDLSLNLRLIKLPIELIDYVIIHELAHTVHMNHSRHFWKLVDSFCPGAKNVDKTLQTWA